MALARTSMPRTSLLSVGKPRIARELKSWKNHARAIFPHVGLILVCLLLGFVGSAIFNRIERPHELAAQAANLEEIRQFRAAFVDGMIDGSKRGLSKDQWMTKAEANLEKLTQSYHRAATKNSLTYADVMKSIKRGNGHHPELTSENADNAGDHWSLTSAFFFSISTMATIGYGNIVPASTAGRIMCVFFCLVGTPLTLITIGDMGKFFSEAVIRSYGKYQILKARFLRRLSKIKWLSYFAGLPGSNANRVREQEPVPVYLVFGILVSYTAVGAAFFSWLENWRYVDAFYFCFISLTTIGYGDILPKQSRFFPLVFIYIGVGVALTTMCIDLVGVHYIDKIHYIGRKFTGKKLFGYLRRKGQIEAAVQQSRMVDRWFVEVQSRERSNQLPTFQDSESTTAFDEEGSSTISPPETPDRYWPTLCSDEQALLGGRQTIPSFQIPDNGSPSSFRSRSRNLPPLSAFWGETFEGSRCPTASISMPHLPGINLESKRETSLANLSASCALTLDNQYDEPGIDSQVSEGSVTIQLGKAGSLSTSDEPGVNLQVQKNLSRPYGFAWLSTESAEVAPAELCDVEQSIRRRSDSELENERCVDQVRCNDDASAETVAAGAVSVVETSAVELCDHDMVDEGHLEQPDSPRILAVATLGIAASMPPAATLAAPTSDDRRGTLSMLFHENIPVYSVETEAVETERAICSALTCPKMFVSDTAPELVTGNYCFVLNGDTIRLDDLTSGDDEWWRPTGHPTKYYYSEEMRKFQKVNVLLIKGKVINARLVTVASSRKISAGATLPEMKRRFSLDQFAMHETNTINEQEVSLAKVLKVTRFYGFWRSCPGFHRIVTVVSPVAEIPEAAPSTSASGVERIRQRIFLQYLWRNASEVEKLRVSLEFNPNASHLVKHSSTSTDPSKRRGGIF